MVAVIWKGVPGLYHVVATVHEPPGGSSHPPSGMALPEKDDLTSWHRPAAYPNTTFERADG